MTIVQAKSLEHGAVHPQQADLLLSVEGLKKQFATRGGLLRRATRTVHAVDGVDFKIGRGETLALVGESGCGKSTTGAMLLGLAKPSEGRIVWAGQDIAGISHQHRRDLCRDIQIVFQDPYSSLDRRMRIFDIIAEPLIIHGIASGAALKARVLELLACVGLGAQHAERLPSQFSGGQRQRIGIARALALEPKLIVLDEPVSALDVSVQAQVLNLLKRLQRQFGLSYLFISHDLSVVRYMADRIAVMYRGKIVETATRDALFDAPSHPYTQALLSAVPSEDPFDRSMRRRVILKGDPPDPSGSIDGCSFHARCFRGRDECRRAVPELVPRTRADHPVACFFPGEEL
jgi:oligopeptide/dipeptide ABC transporter ATP-binding protein